MAEIVNIERQSYKLYSDARTELDYLEREYTKAINVPIEKYTLKSGWTVQADAFMKRIDAAYFSPDVEMYKRMLLDKGGNVLRDIAMPFKPSGRYKMNYVSSENGIPYLSGRNLLQFDAVGLKYINMERGFERNTFALQSGYIAYPADGRVEARLGTPVIITPSRNDWYASVHIGRIKPISETDAGYLYLALSHPSVQAQISSIACGSVVDTIYSEDMGNIIIPPKISFPYQKITDAWKKMDESQGLKRSACELLENLLTN